MLTIQVPQIKLLGIKEILNFGRKCSAIDQYLPSYKYNNFPNCDWLRKVINTIWNKEFGKYISDSMKIREKQMVFKMNFKVDAIPEIVNIFSNSLNVSYMKGRTHFLIRKRD